MRRIGMAVMVCLVALLAAATAYADGFGGIALTVAGKLWGLVSDQALGAIAAVIAGLAIRKLGKQKEQVGRTLVESGEAVRQLGTAILTEDKNEAKKVVGEVKDVFDLYKKTPEKYQDPPGTVAPGIDTVIR